MLLLNIFRKRVYVTKLYYVYQHINKINGKYYIGITSQIPENRWGVNGANYKSSTYFYSAIKKYGWDNFYHIVLFSGLTKDVACMYEKVLIGKLHANDKRFGYNLTTGGDSAFIMSEDVRHRKSLAMLGNKNGLGKPCSKEKAEKISKAQIGKVISVETRKKQSEAAKLRHVPCSDKKRETLRNSYPKMKRVYCEEVDMVYKSIQDCARQLGISASLVCRVCKGKQESTHGYHFKYCI